MFLHNDNPAKQFLKSVPQETRQIICKSSEIFVIFTIKKDSLLFLLLFYIHIARPAVGLIVDFNRGNNMNN